METQTETLLAVKHLNVEYAASNGTVHAVSDVSFTLKRGEILGLAGESGCGKSTLAYGLTRLLRPPALITGGEVLYYPREERAGRRVRSSQLDGPVDILELSPGDLRRFRWNEVSIVFQSAMNALNPVLTVGAQIDDVLRTHRPDMSSSARKSRAIELLDQVGISAERVKSYPHELSGGMRQRAVIAIALALGPELIVMDEPTTALDVVVQREILQLISRLCKEFSTALIFITHDLSLLLELSDNIAIMYAGKMIEKASSEDIYRHPRHPYSYGLLHSFPSLHGPQRKMMGIPGSPPDLRILPSGCAFHPRCPFAFERCRTEEPVLQVAETDQPGQLVSCHLYGQGEAPSSSDFAQKFEIMTEGESV
jgi:peptide/nickel transport system ATP-binding protein